MIENVVHSIGGVASFGIISICLFFAFFSGTLIWAARLDRRYSESMRALPLDEQQSENSQSSNPTSTRP